MKESKRLNVLLVIWAVYAGSVIVQNVLATKSIDIWVFTVTTGIFVSPFVFIVNDVSSELFGYKITKNMIYTAFIINFCSVILYQLAIIFPPSAVYFNNEAFKSIFSTTFRISCASFIAYMSGSLINTGMLVKLKSKYPDSLFVRCVTSTFIGQFLDNVIFAFGAFLFVLPMGNLVSMIAGGTLFEVGYEVILYPVVKTCITKLKKYIGE